MLFFFLPFLNEMKDLNALFFCWCGRSFESCLRQRQFLWVQKKVSYLLNFISSDISLRNVETEKMSNVFLARNRVELEQVWQQVFGVLANSFWRFGGYVITKTPVGSSTSREGVQTIQPQPVRLLISGSTMFLQVSGFEQQECLCRK